MSNWLPDPVLDEDAKVGLSFITIGYGVVLVAVFPTVPLSGMGVAGWFHLGLAAFMLIVSYIGYYSNRVKYAAWRVSFFSFPLLQYIISFVILFLYWELGITVPKRDSHSTLTSEAIIVLIVFVAYLTWDCLLSALGLIIIISYHLRGTNAAVTIDSIYIVGLFAYRYSQWKWSNFWYRPAL